MQFKARAVLIKSDKISAICWQFNMEKMVLLVLFLETVTTVLKKKKKLYYTGYLNNS